MLKRINLFFILIFVGLQTINAQKSYNYILDLRWDATKTIEIDEGVFEERLSFANADHQVAFDFHPNYFKMIELDAAEHFQNLEIIPLNEKVIENNLEILSNSDFKNEYFFEVSELTIKKKPFIAIRILPIKKGPNNKFIRLEKFELIVNTKKKEVSSRKELKYAETSSLSSGSWYKISVDETGIYKLTPDDFRSMGLNVTNPKNIRVYGYGGGMLPEVSGEFPYDDLAENAIYVHGEADGSFDANDYVLFYGIGQEGWTYNADKENFNHHINHYSEKTYYYVNVDKGPGKRIENRSSSTDPADQTFTRFTDYKFHETNTKNIAKSGREWFGETFSSNGSTHNFSLDFPNIWNQENAKVKIAVAASNKYTSRFDYKIDNTSFKSSSIGPKSKYVPANIAEDEYFISPSSSTIDIELIYNYSDAEAWLNYIEVIAKRALKFSESQMHFRVPESIGAGVSKFVISNTANDYVVWDVTDRINIINQTKTYSNSETEFKVETNDLKEFVIFSPDSYKSPSLESSVDNQNLHGLPQCHMVIVTHASFIESAEVLAEHHRLKDNLTVHVVELEKIYNEFSSGSQDIAAIRNFMKMFYDRASNEDEMPKYLLLFGDGSYDNLNRIEGNTNYIPTYQSYESLNKGHFAYVTDDFFGALDDGEGGINSSEVLDGAVDIGVGRLPVQTSSEAEEVVNKILWYSAEESLVNQQTNYDGTISNLADWRNVVCFMADNAPNNSYLKSSEELATLIDTSYHVYNIDKIYLDAYEKVSTPGGNRYPGAKEALNQRFNKGALLINYIGHGGELGLAHERILEISDINAWTNKYNLPLFYTQTCELSRFDDPERESAGEMIFMKPNGGAISMVTTTRPTYASSTMTMARVFFNNAFNPGKDNYKSIGELYMMAKASVASSNSYSNLVGIVLLGDPALKLAYPKYDVITTEINDKPISLELDTIKALGKVSVSGYIENGAYEQIENYNGTIYPIVYDKRSIYTTLGQDDNQVYPFTLQNNIIYKGKVSVVNGEFSFDFIVPKDIAYQYGKGKISYYSENGVIDANGYTTEFIVGGSTENYDPDNEGPNIDLYMNDTLFVSGGITNENPILLAYLSDEHGINTVGTGIGHDIKAVIDGNLSNPIILNSYYEADLDTYQSGVVKYQLSDLSEGEHTLELTAWDIYNNSSSKSISFIVRNSGEVVMEKVKTFPNPFSESVLFEFEHNQAESDIVVALEIYSPMGKLIRKFEKQVSPYGYLMQNFQWDGKSETGINVEDGVYFYTVKLKNKNGQQEKYTNKIIKMKH